MPGGPLIPLIVVFSVVLVSVSVFMWGRAQQRLENSEARRKELACEAEFLRRKMENPAGRDALPKVPLAGEWTVADNLNLRKFFSSDSGVKLRDRAMGMEYQQAARACTDPMHTTHSAARAAGFIDFRKWLESLASVEMEEKLSRSSGAQEETMQQTATNEAVSAERVSFTLCLH